MNILKSAAPSSDLTIKASEVIIPPLSDEYNEATANIAVINNAPADDFKITAPQGGTLGAPLKT